jgi:hypothetical protein
MDPKILSVSTVMLCADWIERQAHKRGEIGDLDSEDCLRALATALRLDWTDIVADAMKLNA